MLVLNTWNELHSHNCWWFNGKKRSLLLSHEKHPRPNECVGKNDTKNGNRFCSLRFGGNDNDILATPEPLVSRTVKWRKFLLLVQSNLRDSFFPRVPLLHITLWRHLSYDLLHDGQTFIAIPLTCSHALSFRYIKFSFMFCFLAKLLRRPACPFLNTSSLSLVE